MRDYSNMPVVNWNDSKAVQKAQAQIQHEEPVILQMPDTFDTTVDTEKFACIRHEETGILYNFDGHAILNWLAVHNQEPDLGILAKACAYSSSLVDIDSKRKRLIVHD